MAPSLSSQHSSSSSFSDSASNLSSDLLNDFPNASSLVGSSRWASSTPAQQLLHLLVDPRALPEALALDASLEGAASVALPLLSLAARTLVSLALYLPACRARTAPSAPAASADDSSTTTIFMKLPRPIVRLYVAEVPAALSSHVLLAFEL